MSSLKSTTPVVKWPMRASARRGCIGCGGILTIEYCSVMNRLRGSGSERGSVGTGAPGGEPACGSAIDPVAKWFSTSITVTSVVLRTSVIAELRASNA
jgi:hypothetical protein